MTNHKARRWWDYLYPHSLRAALVALAVILMFMFALAGTMGQHALGYWFVFLAAAIMFTTAFHWERMDK